jgi:transcriptional regulator with XRE-family HTH domain
MNKPQIAFTEVLGQVIRHRREALAWRQEDLAPAVDITPSAWSRIEAGKTSMTVVQLRRTAQALGTNAWMLLKDAETAAKKIADQSPGVEVVDEAPRPGRSAAGWFISGAAVGALVAGVLALSSRRVNDK